MSQADSGRTFHTPTKRGDSDASFKRLEAGSFEMLKAPDQSAVLEIDATQLAMLLGGVTLESARRRKRYARTG